MDLHSGDLYWPHLHRSPTYPSLDRPIDCHVAIIGSGVSGALVADALTQAGVRNVVMLDRRPASTGSIIASTALLQYELDCGLLDLTKLVGQSAARRCYQLCHAAIDRFAKLADEVGDCDFARRRSLFLDPGEIDLAELEAEAAARRSIGIDVRCLDRATLRREFGFESTGALLSATAAEVDPLKLTHRLIARARDHGLQVFANTGMTEYRPDGNGVTLRTTAGHTVRARHVVFATGYESQSLLKQPGVCLKTTFAVASEPVDDFDGWRERFLIWEARTPYFYARTTTDNRILIGGEDEDTIDPVRRDAVMPQKTHTLIEKFNRIFPKIRFNPAHAWAGVFAESEDSMPYIGPHPAYPHGQFVLGYGGNGITFALLAADIIRDNITGVANADAGLFAFDRSKP